MAKEKLRLDPKTGEFVPVLNEEGQELPDPTPMAPPVGFKREPPLHERIRAMVQHEFLRARAEADFESPEEADDFVIDDDGDDPRDARFALQPGHEHDWEENYSPPKDFKEMRDRLIKAGWSPPEYVGEGQEHSAVKPAKSEKKSNVLDAGTSEDNSSEAPRASGSKS